MVNRYFAPFPTLTTARLTLRQLSTDDAEPIFALRSDREINKYLDRQPSQTIEDAINFIKKINDTIEKNDGIYWVITLTDSNTFVGTICLFSFSGEENKCEIGYELLPAYQGRGIMKEAAEKVIDYAFHTLQLQTIEAFTHNGNQHSTKLLLKCGFIKSTVDTTHPDYTIYTVANADR